MRHPGSTLVAAVTILPALLAINPSKALADSIHLEASPASPVEESIWTLNVSSEASEEGSEVYIGPEENPTACPPTYEAALANPADAEVWHVNSPPPVPVRSGHFSFREEEGGRFNFDSRFCAYLVHNNATTAQAELEVHFLESAEHREVAVARETPVKRLDVRAVDHYGHRRASPGYTTLYVTTSPYAYVTVRLIYVEGRSTSHRTEHVEWEKGATAPASVIHWTCSRLGGVYRYEVTAHTSVGPTLVRHGRFIGASASRCRALARQETRGRNS